MSFKQHNKSDELTWRRINREELLKAGMPEVVMDDERRWNYVLLHGDDQFGTGWDPSWISKAQAADMLSLLRSRYMNPVGLDLLLELEKRLNEK